MYEKYETILIVARLIKKFVSQKQLRTLKNDPAKIARKGTFIEQEHSKLPHHSWIIALKCYLC